MKQILQMPGKRNYFVIFKKPESLKSLFNSPVVINGKPLRITPYLEISSLDREANIQIEDLDPKYNT